MQPRNMYRNTLITCFLVILCLGISFFVLHKDDLQSFQTLIAAMVAFSTAAVGYFLTLDSIHEQRRLEEAAQEKSAAADKRKHVYFMLLQMQDFMRPLRVWTDIALEKPAEDAQTCLIRLRLLKDKIELPPALNQKYTTYFFLSEEAVRALSHFLWYVQHNAQALQNLESAHMADYASADMPRRIEAISKLLETAHDLFAALKQEVPGDTVIEALHPGR